MESICRFLPPKDVTHDVKTVHFVYETEFSTQSQPFIRPIYYLHLVTAGTGVMHVGDNLFELKEGTLFFFFPAVPYTITADEDFRYIYISFMGQGVSPLFEKLGIVLNHPVFQGFSHLIDLWMSSIVRVTQINANILTESVLLHTLSYISRSTNCVENNKNSENLLPMIVDYVDTHYRENSITLRSVADMFSYTEKYLSRFFKTRMGIGFNEYVNELRLQYARQLISEGLVTVSKIAQHCGFGDPLYFSKVFKKKTGMSPREYIRNEHR